MNLLKGSKFLRQKSPGAARFQLALEDACQPLADASPSSIAASPVDRVAVQQLAELLLNRQLDPNEAMACFKPLVAKPASDSQLLMVLMVLDVLVDYNSQVASLLHSELSRGKWKERLVSAALLSAAPEVCSKLATMYATWEQTYRNHEYGFVYRQALEELGQSGVAPMPVGTAGSSGRLRGRSSQVVVPRPSQPDTAAPPSSQQALASPSSPTAAAATALQPQHDAADARVMEQLQQVVLDLDMLVHILLQCEEQMGAALEQQQGGTGGAPGSRAERSSATSLKSSHIPPLLKAGMLAARCSIWQARVQEFLSGLEMREGTLSELLMVHDNLLAALEHYKQLAALPEAAAALKKGLRKQRSSSTKHSGPGPAAEQNGGSATAAAQLDLLCLDDAHASSVTASAAPGTISPQGNGTSAMTACGAPFLSSGSTTAYGHAVVNGSGSMISNGNPFADAPAAGTAASVSQEELQAALAAQAAKYEAEVAQVKSIAVTRLQGLMAQVRALEQDKTQLQQQLHAAALSATLMPPPGSMPVMAAPAAPPGVSPVALQQLQAAALSAAASPVLLPATVPGMPLAASPASPSPAGSSAGGWIQFGGDAHTPVG